MLNAAAAHAVPGMFAAVLASDNAVPHLLTADDLAAAAGSMRGRVRDGGLLVAGMRDYDALVPGRVACRVPRRRGHPSSGAAEIAIRTRFPLS